MDSPNCKTMWPSLCPFPWEVNHNAGAAGAMPWVIEYWFVRPESAFMRNMGPWRAMMSRVGVGVGWGGVGGGRRRDG